MPRNFAEVFKKYKTYDDSHGRGSVEEWSRLFNSRMNSSEARRIISDEDPLVVLGLSSIPNLYDLNAIYRKLMLAHHPDRGGDPVRCKKIIAAYTILEKKVSK